MRPLPAMPDPARLAPPEGFADRLAGLGIRIDPEAISAIGSYLSLLLAMNEHMNLTAVVDPAAAWEKHALDALTLLPLLAEIAPGSRLVDVGSGGGVPGLPIAIARPDLDVTLVEATQKKAAFLAATAKALGLRRVKVRAERAEALASGDLQGTFHAVTARAVGKLVTLVPLTAPFARPGGLLLLVKGQRADEEIAEAAQAIERGRCVHEKTVSTPTGRIVVLRRRPRR